MVSPKLTVFDWDIDPNNNSEIEGISIAEGCPAANLNNADRATMSQIAKWLVSAAAPLLKTGGAVTGAITGMLNGSTVLDGAGTARFVGYRNIPLTAKTAAYTIALTDAGQGISITTGGVTIPLNATVAFAIGDTVAIYNNSASAQNISVASGVTLRLGGTTTTGARSLAGYGFCVLLKVGADEWSTLNGGIS